MRKFTDNIAIYLVIIGLALAVIARYSLARDDAAEILLREGYTNIDIGYYGLIGCSRDEKINIPFTATKNGATVSGHVCSGYLMTGNVIRF